MPQPLLVADTPTLRRVCDSLLEQDRYGFDTEFHHEKTYYPRLALIQVAWEDQIAIIDPLAVNVGPLGDVLRGPGTAVAHAADQDVAVLDAACGAVPTRLFDTQAAAGFLGMSSPSLARLAEQVLGVTLAKGDRLTDWVKRPLSDAQLAYAAGDVAHLLALHSAVIDELRALGRLSWAEEECAEALQARRVPQVPEEAWWRISGYRSLRGPSRGIAQEVAAWRERRAARLDVPRRTVLGDLPLAAMVQSAPEDRRTLREVRGIDGRHLTDGGVEEILEAVRRGRSLAPDQLRLPAQRHDDDMLGAAIAVAAGLVAQLAADEQIDAGLLATRADLTDLLAGAPGRLDHGWRSTLVGEPVRRLKAGAVAVAFDPGGRLVLEDRAGGRAAPS